ncbi:1-acyl-sn-glycerol-3-phosphate acyltransferase [Candidatus Woesearchaeota archaeon]|nr:1-acyl-sn-glycerol-3-phosphate acyltransferase [Candidatus Woesearchaeota archaeon]
MVYPILKITLLPALRLFLKDVKGLENIPKKGPFIITSNHESYLDPLLIISVITPILDKKIHFLASKGRFWDFFGDRISGDWAGCIPIDEGKGKALEELLSLLKKSEIVGIFIEGARSLDGALKRGKTGVVRLALKAHVPILPVGLCETFDIAPREKLIPRLRRAKLSIGQLIYLNKYYKKPANKKLLRELTNDIMQKISKLANKTYNY